MDLLNFILSCYAGGVTYEMLIIWVYSILTFNPDNTLRI